MVKRTRKRALTPDRWAAVRVSGLVGRHWRMPDAEERARIVAQVRELSAPYPGVLAHEAAVALILADEERVPALREQHRIAAELCLEAGADPQLMEHAAHEYRQYQRWSNLW